MLTVALGELFFVKIKNWIYIFFCNKDVIQILKKNLYSDKCQKGEKTKKEIKENEMILIGL